MLQNLKREKPWAKLRMSRCEYETKCPWAKSVLSRKRWEEGLEYLPDEAIDTIYREVEADLLVEAIFGKESPATRHTTVFSAAHPAAQNWFFDVSNGFYFSASPRKDRGGNAVMDRNRHVRLAP